MIRIRHSIDDGEVFELGRKLTRRCGRVNFLSPIRPRSMLPIDEPRLRPNDFTLVPSEPPKQTRKLAPMANSALRWRESHGSVFESNLGPVHRRKHFHRTTHWWRSRTECQCRLVIVVNVHGSLSQANCRDCDMHDDTCLASIKPPESVGSPTMRPMRLI